MSKNKFSVLICLGFALVLAIAVAIPGVAPAQECRLIKVHSFDSPAGKFLIEPATLEIAKGDCVVWINWVGTHSIKVVFGDAKQCEIISDAPSGFKAALNNCYVTDLILIGGTASLRFKETGTYEYKIEAPGRKALTGKIIVK